MPEPVQKLPLPEDDRRQWDGAIEQSRAAKKTVLPWMDANLAKYAPRLDASPDSYGQALNTNRDFTLVERKIPELFYQRPDVSAIPSPLFAGMEHLLDTHTLILNEKLGLDGVHAKALMRSVLFDIECPAGAGWTIMGYDATTVDVPMLDPLTGRETMAPVPIHEDCYWRHVSPKQGLKPSGFRSTRWDDAPWLGVEFELPVRVAKRKRWVPDDYRGATPSPDLYFDFGYGSHAGEEVARGVLIYYKSALYRDERPHPQHYTLLILMDGVEPPAEHKDSPLQTLDAQGRLTPDSLLGNPIHPFTIRTLTDSSEVPSDCTISRPLVNELNTFREQMVQFRDAAILRWMYNVDTLPAEALAKIVRSPMGGFIGVPAEAFVGDGAIKELPHGSYPRENFSINDYIDNDLARTHAIDEGQSGVSSHGDSTATEEQLKQNNVNARLGYERGIVLDRYLQGVTKYSAIVQRFLPVEEAAKIVGPERAQEWDSWRTAVPASLAFTALPDAALRTDLASERKRRMDEYTYWANDPFINRVELLKQTLPYLGYGPKVLNETPPEKSPEPTKPGLSLKGEDLNPLMPQFPILVEVLAQCGIKISPQAIQQAQDAAMNQVLMQQTVAAASATDGEGEPDTAHGGKVAQMEGLDKHQVDKTGGMQGSGQPAPMGAGGSLM